MFVFKLHYVTPKLLRTYNSSTIKGQNIYYARTKTIERDFDGVELKGRRFYLRKDSVRY